MAFVQADTPDQAARANMTVQAGPKTQFGGFHCGLRSFAYQDLRSWSTLLQPGQELR